MKNGLYDAALRRWFPDRYRWQTRKRTLIEYRERFKTTGSPDERSELEAALDQEIKSWRLTRQSIDDDDLVAKAARMDLTLDDITAPARSNHLETGHWNFDDPRAVVLYADSRRALEKAVRERAPIYRKERREIRELYLKIFLQVMTAITGLGGTIIGLISVWKK
jgi:hypothetical protein